MSSPEMKEKLRRYEKHLAKNGYKNRTMGFMMMNARRFASFLEGKEFEKGQWMRIKSN